MLFAPQRKDGTNSYKVRKLLAIFFQLNCSNFRINRVKGLRVAKIVKEITFEGVWSMLESNTFSRDNSYEMLETKSRFHLK